MTVLNFMPQIFEVDEITPYTRGGARGCDSLDTSTEYLSNGKAFHYWPDCVTTVSRPSSDGFSNVSHVTSWKYPTFIAGTIKCYFMSIPCT